MTARRGASIGSERGSVTLELAILTPALILLLALMVLVGRVQVATSAVEHAAHVAARDASLARTPEAARTAAVTAALRELTAQDVDCTSPDVTVDTTGFAVPLGQPARITATVTCLVDFTDLAAPAPLPGSRRLTGTATSALDAWRTR